MIKGKCSLCNKEFMAYPSQFKSYPGLKRDHSFCSRNCRIKWFASLNKQRIKKITRVCEDCSKEFSFIPTPRNISKVWGKFCSRYCQNQGHSRFMKNMWGNYNFRAKQVLIAIRNLNLRPNLKELFLLALLKRIDKNWEYVGDGSLIVGGLNPDFIYDHKIIELFGDYWHNPIEIPRRAAIFYRQGYTMLVIWEHELKDEQTVVAKVNQFMGSVKDAAF